MSKAECRAIETYPKDIEEYIDVNGVKSVVDNNSWQRTIFLKGYHQAEKDLELNWEDVSLLKSILFDVEHECFTNYSYEEFCREVLKRFKKQRDEGSI